MKVAIPLFSSRVSPRFGFAPEILVADVADGHVSSTTRLPTAGMTPNQVLTLLAAQGVDTLICSGVSGPCRNLMLARGMQLISGVIGEADAALDAFAAGKLKPGPIGRGRGCRRRMGHRGPPWAASG